MAEPGGITVSESREVVGTKKEFAIYLIINIAIGFLLFFLLNDISFLFFYF